MEKVNCDVMEKANNAMNKSLEMRNNANKRGYKVEDKDYFQKVYDYMVKNNFDTTRFLERLETLQLIKVDEKSYGYVGSHYDEKDNKIVYVDEKDLYHEVFHLATDGIIKKFSDGTKAANGLSEGITDMFVTKIKKDASINYVLQMTSAKVLEKIYGSNIFKPYFGGTLADFIKQFDDQDLVADFITDLDEYTEVSTNMINGNLTSSFNNVIWDLVEICSTVSDKDLDVILNMIENDLNREEMRDILNIVEYGNKKKFDIREAFELNPIRTNI